MKRLVALEQKYEMKSYRNVNIEENFICDYKLI